MKPHLMFQDKDFALDVEWTYRTDVIVRGPRLPAHTDELKQDLELGAILQAMSGGESLLWSISTRAMLTSLTSWREIGYRQDILADCLAHPEMAREMFSIASEAIAGEGQIHEPWGRRPALILRRSV